MRPIALAPALCARPFAGAFRVDVPRVLDDDEPVADRPSRLRTLLPADNRRAYPEPMQTVASPDL